MLNIAKCNLPCSTHPAPTSTFQRFRSIASVHHPAKSLPEPPAAGLSCREAQRGPETHLLIEQDREWVMSRGQLNKGATRMVPGDASGCSADFSSSAHPREGSIFPEHLFPPKPSGPHLHGLRHPSTRNDPVAVEAVDALPDVLPTQPVSPVPILAS